MLFVLINKLIYIFSTFPTKILTPFLLELDGTFPEVHHEQVHENADIFCKLMRGSLAVQVRHCSNCPG